MGSRLARTCLYAGPIGVIRDVCCRAHAGDPAKEETSDQDTLVLVRRGAFVRQLAGDEHFADAAAVLFFNRGEPYRVHHPVTGGDDCTALAFETSVLDEAMQTIAPKARGGVRFPWPQGSCNSRTLGGLQQMRRLIRDQAVDPLAIEEWAIRLLHELLSTSFGTLPPRRGRDATHAVHRALAKRVRSILAGSFRETHHISEIAAAVHSSPFHLARVFAAHTGCSMHRYRNRLRLREGLDQLSDSPREDLTGLALDLGFSSHSHFTTAFRREFGFRPSELRHQTRPARREMSRILKA